MFGCAELMMGANHIRVRGFDGVTRMGRIKGKIKKKVWIREGDILIIIPWNFQDEKCDIIYRYTGPQVEWLRRNNYLWKWSFFLILVFRSGECIVHCPAPVPYRVHRTVGIRYAQHDHCPRTGRCPGPAVPWNWQRFVVTFLCSTVNTPLEYPEIFNERQHKALKYSK